MPDVYGNCKFFLYWNLSEISPLPLHMVYFSTKKSILICKTLHITSREGKTGNC